MKLQRIRIVSNCISYGPPPLPEDEVEQHLTVSSTGRVWFTSYLYGGGYEKYQRQKIQQIYIGKDMANQILSLLAKYIESEPIQCFATDIGDWTMTVKYKTKEEKEFKGSLCGDITIYGEDMTDYIRSSIGLENLFVFG